MADSIKGGVVPTRDTGLTLTARKRGESKEKLQRQKSSVRVKTNLWVSLYCSRL